MAESSSSEPITSTAQYDVFVSFRGEDVRDNFVSHLQAALKGNRITTFFDEELLRGEEISPALLKAIEQSSISIVVFSQNYASSRWCLHELLKIVECRNFNRQTVLPVFYHVDPSDVRKQTGSYAEAFIKHEKTPNNRKDEIQRWKDALTAIANLSGLDSTTWRQESDLISKIIQEVVKKIAKSTSNDVDDLVGIEHRVERIESFLRLDSNDVLILGIWGMGGIGKTAVATTLFNKIKDQFDGHFLLENIKENSGTNGCRLPKLRSQILSNFVRNPENLPKDISCQFFKKMMCRNKALIILDDIDRMEQLENLAGKHNWFGSGSRIVITTRDKQLLTKADEVYDYGVEQLTDEEALLLFSRHMFDTNHPPEAYLEVSTKAVDYASGIPLALKLLSSKLRDKSVSELESALAQLQARKSEDKYKIVKKVLTLSYESLSTNEKNILLDIACFFKGEDVELATSIWDRCGFFPHIGLSVLRDKCFISTRNNGQLWMHDLIQEICKIFVMEENVEEPGGRSRLFDPKDIFHMFETNNGTSKIECIILDLSEINEVLVLRKDAFVKMEKLRMLKFFYRELDESTKIRLPRGLKMLPNSLRYLFWDRYPHKFLPLKFDAQNVVEMSLRQSSINQLWKGQWMFKYASICLKHLKKLDLSGCSDFSNLSVICDGMELLNELSLEGTGVSSLPSSIENLNRLLELKLFNCKKLASLPENICNLKGLKSLNLNGCKNLQHLPENIGNLESLEHLSADGTSIQHVPSSIICLKNIWVLSFRGCRGIMPLTFSDWECSWLVDRSRSSDNNNNYYTSCCMGLQLPSSLGGFQILGVLNLSNCNLVEAPSSLHSMPMLSILDLSGNKFESMPQTIFHDLCGLWHLNLSYCTRLRSMPELPMSLTFLEADECTSLESFVSSFIFYGGIGKGNLKMYSFGNCLKLKKQCNNILESMVKGVHPAAKTLLKKNLFVLDCCDYGLDVHLTALFPGSEIPEWFSNYQTVGNATTLHLPPHDGLAKPIGFAFCFILPPNESSRSFSFIHFELTFREHGKKQYGRIMQGVRSKSFSLKEDHVVLGFTSMSPTPWPNKYSNHSECSLISFSFGTYFADNFVPIINVKKCAVRMLTVEDKMQLNFNSSFSSTYLDNLRRLLN